MTQKKTKNKSSISVTVIGPTGIDLSKYPSSNSSRKITSSLPPSQQHQQHQQQQHQQQQQQQQHVDSKQQQQQQHVDSRQTIPAELYASLLMQLRRASEVASAASDASPGTTFSPKI